MSRAGVVDIHVPFEAFLRYPGARLEAEAGPGGHDLRTGFTVAGAAGDARGSLGVDQPVPAWSTGSAVAALEPRPVSGRRRRSLPPAPP
jgi:hypothetical protein